MPGLTASQGLGLAEVFALGAATRRRTRSKVLGDSSAPSSRAVLMKRSDWAGLSGLAGFRFTIEV